MGIYKHLSMNRSSDSIVNKLRELKRSLLDQLENIELALKSAEATTESTIKEAEILKLYAESKVVVLENKVKETEQALQAREFSIKEFETSLTTKIYDLEHKLREKEDLLILLEKRNVELSSHKDGGEDSKLKPNNYKYKIEEISFDQTPYGLVTLREEDVVAMDDPNTNLQIGKFPSAEKKEKQVEELKTLTMESESSSVELREKNFDLSNDGKLNKFNQSSKDYEQSLLDLELTRKSTREELPSKIYDFENHLIEIVRPERPQQDLKAELERLQWELQHRHASPNSGDKDIKIVKGFTQEKDSKPEPFAKAILKKNQK